MREGLMLLILAACAVWGYFLMGRVDRYMNAHVRGGEEPPVTEKEKRRRKKAERML